MDQHYEYEYQVGPATWRISLANGLFSYRAGFISKSIQQNNIKGFGIGILNRHNIEINQGTTPDNLDIGISQLLISYNEPEKMRNKLLRINIDQNQPQCKKMLGDLYRKYGSAYKGAGSILDISKELGFSQKWVPVMVGLMVAFILGSGILAIIVSAK